MTIFAHLSGRVAIQNNRRKKHFDDSYILYLKETMDNPDITAQKSADNLVISILQKLSPKNTIIFMDRRSTCQSNGKSDVLPVVWHHQDSCPYQ